MYIRFSIQLLPLKWYHEYFPMSFKILQKNCINFCMIFHFIVTLKFIQPFHYGWTFELLPSNCNEHLCTYKSLSQFYFFGRHFKKRNYRSSIRNIFMSLGTSSTIVFQKDNASFHSQKNVLPSSSTHIKNED